MPSTLRKTRPPTSLSFVANSARDTPLVSSLSGAQKEQVSLYVDALLEWNQRMNLTAVTEPSGVMKRHVEDSLAILPVIQNDYAAHCSTANDGLNVVDVGSGAGLPGVVLAIACPDWKVTLLESMHKRCVFLEHVVKHLDLSNVQVVRGRAESIGQTIDFREAFDVAVARAVAELRILAEYCIPLVRVGGLFVAAKGYNPQVHIVQFDHVLEEVETAKKAIRLMGSSILHLHSDPLSTVQSEGPYGQRTALVCLKQHPTPSKYPRQPGVPAKMPL
ncbi:Ribosomal RNA small subunit methyltransferase G [Nymphaea thermarum]|nr:Ribosomal RNA small subunit methyltransferase G [Nymphaea thermarum]